MQELRFVAVSEDGSYAVLAVPGRSARFTLPIDERLRAVALGQASRLAQYEIEVESPLRPKEIQARIRAGETAEEIADASGIPVERVRWFEGPVLAERAYIANQAQAASVRRAGDSAPGPRLGDIVPERMSAAGADPEDAQWDSRKRGDGNWQVSLTFPSGGRLYVAEWVFDPRRRHVAPADEAAERLSLPEWELPPLSASVPGEATVTPITPRLGAVAGGLRYAPATRAPSAHAQPPHAQPAAYAQPAPHAQPAAHQRPAPAPVPRAAPPPATWPAPASAARREPTPVWEPPAWDPPAPAPEPPAARDPAPARLPAVPQPPAAATIVPDYPEPARAWPSAAPGEFTSPGTPEHDAIPPARPSSPQAAPSGAAPTGAVSPGAVSPGAAPPGSAPPETAPAAALAPPAVPADDPAPAAPGIAAPPEPVAVRPEAMRPAEAASAEPASVLSALAEQATVRPAAAEPAPVPDRESPSAEAPTEPEPEPEPAEQSARPRQSRKGNAKGRRSSVPSWDEIMLGSSRQHD